MRVRTDDEVYRVDAVWLGPPKVTMPWRARYVAWGVGLLVFLLVLTIERQIGIGIGFFPLAYGMVITVFLTKVICSRISHERPLSAVLAMWARELTSPRERAAGTGGAVTAARIRVSEQRPKPAPKRGGARRPPTAPARPTAPTRTAPTRARTRTGRGGSGRTAPARPVGNRSRHRG